jgi:dihydrofolate reductase
VVTSARAPLAMVAALTPSRVIGRAGGIPWRYPEDMQHFRRVTTGHAIIMGRTTYDSIGKPLPKRRNIVITRDAALRIEGCETAPSLERAIAMAREQDGEPRVIGGGQIYAAALPLATKLFLTHLAEDHEGDVYFPALDAREWIEEERREVPGLTFVTLVRR